MERTVFSGEAGRIDVGSLTSPKSLVREGKSAPFCFVLARVGRRKPEIEPGDAAHVPKSFFQTRVSLFLFAYFPRTVRKLLVGDGNATKAQVDRVLAAKYPDLTIYLRQDRLWKEKHWQNMFDAIAVGLTCLHGDFNEAWRANAVTARHS